MSENKLKEIYDDWSDLQGSVHSVPDLLLCIRFEIIKRQWIIKRYFWELKAERDNLQKNDKEREWRQINFVLPECNFYLEDGSCKRANISPIHHYSCNEMWCEKKIQLKEG